MQKKHDKTSFLRIWVSNWQASKELLHSKTVSNRHKTNFTLKQSLILLSWTSSVIGLFLKISNCPIRFYSMGQGFITQIFWKSMVQSHSSLVTICFKMCNAFSDAEGHATGRNYMNEGMFWCGRIYNLMTWSYKVSDICDISLFDAGFVGWRMESSLHNRVLSCEYWMVCIWWTCASLFFTIVIFCFSAH